VHDVEALVQVAEAAREQDGREGERGVATGARKRNSAEIPTAPLRYFSGY